MLKGLIMNAATDTGLRLHKVLAIIPDFVEIMGEDIAENQPLRYILDRWCVMADWRSIQIEAEALKRVRSGKLPPAGSEEFDEFCESRRRRIRVERFCYTYGLMKAVKDTGSNEPLKLFWKSKIYINSDLQKIVETLRTIESNSDDGILVEPKAGLIEHRIIVSLIDNIDNVGMPIVSAMQAGSIQADAVRKLLLHQELKSLAEYDDYVEEQRRKFALDIFFLSKS